MFAFVGFYLLSRSWLYAAVQKLQQLRCPVVHSSIIISRMVHDILVNQLHQETEISIWRIQS